MTEEERKLALVTAAQISNELRAHRRSEDDTPIMIAFDATEAHSLVAVLREIAAGQKWSCHHEPYQGQCAHCGIQFKNGRPLPAPPAEEGK